MHLARRNLLHEPLQVLLSVTGIGLAVMLVIVLFGVLSGVERQTADYLAHVPGSVVVAPAGTEDFLMAPVPLSRPAIDAVRSAPGVDGVLPLVSRMVVLQMHERREATFIIGYEPALGGGPRQLSDGRLPERDGEVVLGRLLARRHRVSVGDTVSVLGHPLRVSGLAADPSPLMTSFAYIPRSTLETLGVPADTATMLVVTPREGVSPEELRDDLASVAGTTVLLKQQVIANDIDLFTSRFQPVVRLMAVVALLAGTLVVGLLIYSATLQKQREYGVLKAVGASNGALYQAVATQALVVAILGVIAGVALASVVARLIMQLRPEFLIPVTQDGVMTAASAGLIMAVLASMAPARLIARLAPADVFRR